MDLKNTPLPYSYADDCKILAYRRELLEKVHVGLVSMTYSLM